MKINQRLAFLSAQVHGRFLGLLLVCYVLAALLPRPGLWIRDISLGNVSAFGEKTPITLPMLMLALLLLNAGLGARPAELKKLPRFASVLLAGLVANDLIPIIFIFGAIPLVGFWLDAEEVQSTLLGFALVASMPIAGSSTAWSQNVEGSMALSVGLVVLSTLLSPLTTPMAIFLLLFLATGESTKHLNQLAAHSTQVFLTICVVLPAVLGGVIGWCVGEKRLELAKSCLKLSNQLVLLVLIYSNAATTLPEAIAFPDPEFLLTNLAISLGLCALAFGSGWALAAVLRLDAPQRASLMFGLGMNNNGTGIVLASVAMANHPRVMLPIITYNLVQHLVAGAVAFMLGCHRRRNL